MKKECEHWQVPLFHTASQANTHLHIKIVADRLAVVGRTVHLPDKGHVVVLPVLLQLGPVVGHGPAVATPRGKELDENGLALGQRLEVVDRQGDGRGGAECGYQKYGGKYGLHGDIYKSVCTNRSKRFLSEAEEE